MLEVDEDSRLGRELIAGGTRYHAHFVPNEDLIADFYLTACETLGAAGVQQYEISNFARPGFESRHNLKYWTRQPYLGFGVDAHSMLVSADQAEAVRFANPDSLDRYVAGSALEKTHLSRTSALEESFFLGLRLNRGVDLSTIAAAFGQDSISNLDLVISGLVRDGLLERHSGTICLTSRGRLFSNEVFERFLSPADIAMKP
jgi:oxygen-independent coproporphyrinogen III oxidase